MAPCTSSWSRPATATSAAWSWRAGLRQPPPANFVAYGERRVAEARSATEYARRAAQTRLELLGFPRWRPDAAAVAVTGGVRIPRARPPPAPLIRRMHSQSIQTSPTTAPICARSCAACSTTCARRSSPCPIRSTAIPTTRRAGSSPLLAIDEWIGSRWPRHQAPRVVTYLCTGPIGRRGGMRSRPIRTMPKAR